MFEIEKNVELNTRKVVYPFQDMEVGDSFSFPVNLYHKVASAASGYGRRNNMKFSMRSFKDEGVGRIWRTT